MSKVRPARAEELNEVLRLARETVPHFSGVRFGAQYFSRGWVGVIGQPGSLRAFIWLHHCVRHPWTSIYDLGVREPYRRSGLGKMLVQWAQRGSRTGTLRCLCEVDNHVARRFYRALGFRVVGAKINSRGIRHVILQCDRPI